MAGRSPLLVIPVRSSTDFIEAKTCSLVTYPTRIVYLFISWIQDLSSNFNASAYAPRITLIKQLHPATKRTTTA